MGKTKIFISSTCYDLTQIRQDLKDSIAAMGHIPITSENKDFPVNPTASTVENCIEAVKNEADIFILIIGNRYGYKIESGKSITNLEFLAALQKKIPVYSFTLKSLIHYLPLWKKNPEMDFSECVDDTKVFEFVDDVRSKQGMWNFEFETAQDIIDILKSQLSILFSSTLAERQVLKTTVEDSILSNLSGKAMEILLRRPDSFEMRVFMQMMSDEIGKYSFLKNDCTYSICINKGVSLKDPSKCISWQSDKLQDLNASIKMLNNLFSAFEHYYGEPGVPSDIKGLYYVAVRYGELYGHLLQWVIDVKSTDVCEECKTLNDLFAELPKAVINQLESYPVDAMKAIERSIADVDSGKLAKGSEVSLVLHVGLDGDVQKRYTEELQRVGIGLLNQKRINE